MNIAINALSARQGGGQVYLSNLLRFAADYDDLKISCITTAEFAHLYEYPSVEIITVAKSADNVLKRILWEKQKLPALLKDLEADLAFCPGGTIGFTPPDGCKTAATFQNMLIFDKNNRKKYPLGARRLRLALLEILSAKSFRQADLVIFLSKFAKKVIDKKIPHRSGDSVIIPHGLEERFRSNGQNNSVRYRPLPAGEYLLYTSVITNFKNHLEVVRAYDILTRKRNTREILIFAGPAHKDYEKKVRDEIKRRGLNNQVFIMGEISRFDMPSVYHHAKAHIYASTCENCPNIVIESLASGKLTYLANNEPMPEIAGDAAVYFNPNNPHQLAYLLAKYLDNEKFIQSIGQKAVQQSLKYDWKKTAALTFNAFRNLLNHKIEPVQQKEKIYQTI